MTRTMLAVLLLGLASTGPAQGQAPAYDVLIRGGTVYDGSGGKPFRGDVAIHGDRIVYVGARAPGAAAHVIDARGKAVSPGFFNMLAHPQESLLVDPRGLSDLQQGVTTEVLGEVSQGPLTPEMKARAKQRQIDIRYEIDWTTLGEYLRGLERRGISPNVASFVGAATVRTYVMGERDGRPTPAQLDEMKALVRQAMEEGALGVTTALIYAPATFQTTDDLKALASEAGRCGGIYSVHMRNEGDHIEKAVAETLDIARVSGAPAHIYHLKFAGQRNWSKIEAVLADIERARASGLHITADMYTYTAGATGLDASMPRWVQEGGLEAWIQRLKDPAIRARVLAEMRDQHPAWENLSLNAGPDGMLMLQFKNPSLKALTGKTLADIARTRGTTPEDTMIDLVIEDGSRVGVAYFQMSEDNIRRQIQVPWISFGSDAGAYAPEGVFLQWNAHPRAYGNFARLLSRYVRDERLIPLETAIHRLTGLSADTLQIHDRGRLEVGDYADVVVFDPVKVQDYSTYERPHQLSSGVEQVFVNGVHALKDGQATRAPSGRFVKGRAYKSDPAGGCRASAKHWSWTR